MDSKKSEVAGIAALLIGMMGVERFNQELRRNLPGTRSDEEALRSDTDAIRSDLKAVGDDIRSVMGDRPKKVRDRSRKRQRGPLRRR